MRSLPPAGSPVWTTAVPASIIARVEAFKLLGGAMADPLQYVYFGLAGGAAAFGHCLGMCGGFALHLSQGHGRAATLGRQLLWHAGKTSTYVMLGALAGFLGNVVATGHGFAGAQKVIACAAGVIMLLMGARLLGLLPGLRGGATGAGLFGGIFRRFTAQPTPPAAFALGLMTGLLPCPIVFGFLALALQSGSVLTGMATMAAMGVGTVWALLLLGMTGYALGVRARRWGAVLAGILLVLFGTAMVLRGVGIMQHLMGHHHGGAMQVQMEMPAN
jgi:sulfite exporter TauE/SafE